MLEELRGKKDKVWLLRGKKAAIYFLQKKEKL